MWNGNGNGNGIPTWTTQIRSIPNPTHFLPSLAVSASTRRAISSSSFPAQANLKGLGLADLTNFTTSHKSNSKPKEVDEQSAVDRGGQLSGSDILLAMQQADLRKKNKKKSGREVTKSKRDTTLAGQGDDNDDDDFTESSGVRPLMIKSDWGKRIQDLERRLLEISDI